MLGPAAGLLEGLERTGRFRSSAVSSAAFRSLPGFVYLTVWTSLVVDKRGVFVSTPAIVTRFRHLRPRRGTRYADDGG
jgi:hypothetical protein